MQNKQHSRYTFQTIVAPAEVRSSFTDLRTKLSTSDKHLMQAIWNIAMSNVAAVEAEVQNLQFAGAQERSEKKELKAAAKKKAKPEKAEKAPKKVSKKKTVEKSSVVVDDDDDVPCMVVDGTVS